MFFMNNYYEFTTLINDEDSSSYFNLLPSDTLKRILNEIFVYIESYLKNYSNVFKYIFNDYDEFYYSCLSLIDELNDIKIILNILKGRECEK